MQAYFPTSGEPRYGMMQDEIMWRNMNSLKNNDNKSRIKIQCV